MSELKQIHDEVSRECSLTRVMPRIQIPRAHVGVQQTGIDAWPDSEHHPSNKGSLEFMDLAVGEQIRNAGGPLTTGNPSTSENAHYSRTNGAASGLGRTETNNFNSASSIHQSHHTNSENESIMFSQSSLSGMRRKRNSPNIGAALWEAKQLGISSPQTQMEYAHAVVFGTSKMLERIILVLQKV